MWGFVGCSCLSLQKRFSRFKNRGLGIRARLSKGTLGAGNRAFENGAGHGFNIGAGMLYNIPAPLLKPRTVRAQKSKSHLVRHKLATQH